ncbi:plasmid stabilization protein [Gluconacetobacter sacchari DSM 12717]|nr:type II toxin-antitoxin system RelE/ParE family toxin [Gluconacetobacter sacchari]GBQ24062.1 plasmid stabilization protein [Gluconacetobacter sacchari DSM 12717]
MTAFTIVAMTDEAVSDLIRIRNDLGATCPNTASRIAVQIVAVCDRLSSMPERGRPGLFPNTREICPLWPYRVVYRIADHGVDVLRIWNTQAGELPGLSGFNHDA